MSTKASLLPLALALTVGAGACKFPYPADVPDSDGGDGGSIDADERCEGDLYGYALSTISPCDLPRATVPLDLSAATRIDTTDGVVIIGGVSQPLPGTALVAQTSGPMVRVVSATGLIVPASANVVVVGDYPLLLAVRSDTTISGTFDLTAQSGGGVVVRTSPAGRRVVCATGSGTAGSGAAAEGGGGGGGALGGAGGPGGAGMGGAATSGQQGVPLANPTVAPLWGGCPGSASNTGVQAGEGGGAIQISVKGALIVEGTIAVGGGGGRGASSSQGGGGGGGGGSGGTIVLEAGVQVRGGGNLTANGGGGGGGSGGMDGLSGRATSSMSAAGGPGAAGAGAGGAGGASAMVAGQAGEANVVGGGGGGGGGLIWVRAPSVTFSGQASPNVRRSVL